MEAMWRDRNTREKKNTHTVLGGKAEGKNPLAVQCITGRIKLKWI